MSPAAAMTLKWDVSGSDPERAAGRNFEQPKPGVYRAKIVKCILEKPADKAQRVVVTYQIEDDKAGDGNGAWLSDYLNVESEAAAWRLDQFLLAVGEATESKRKGSTNLAKLVEKEVKIRVKADSYTPEGATESQYRAKIGAVLAAGATSDDHDVEDPHAVAEETVDEEWTKFLGMEEEDLAAAEEEIRPYAEQYGIDPDTIDTWAEVIELINDAMNEGDANQDAIEAAAAGEDEAPEDYDSWALADITAELEARGLDTKGPKSAKVKRLVESDETGPFGSD